MNFVPGKVRGQNAAKEQNSKTMKNLRYILSSLFLAAAFLCAGAASLPVKRAAASEKINMGSIFSDNMVLQREKKVEIYGQAEAGRKVSVSFNGQLKTCTADEYGRFLVELDGMRADATGKTLTVSAGGAEKRFENVLIGEVYYGGIGDRSGSFLRRGLRKI